MSLTIAEEIEELKRKITLLGKYIQCYLILIMCVCVCVCADGDKKAYKESSQWTIHQNKDIISQLRQENKMLRAKLSKKMMVSNNNMLAHNLTVMFSLSLSLIG